MHELCKPVKSAVVRARIDPSTKSKAEEALEGMGLTLSDAIRIFVTRVATEGAIPFRLRASDTWKPTN